jgi:hypothetical protein
MSQDDLFSGIPVHCHNYLIFMHFLIAIALCIGLPLAYMRARFGGRHLLSPKLRGVGPLWVAFFPQWLAFYLPATRVHIPDAWIPTLLVSSQLLLLFFAWQNRRQPGFWALGLGVALNWLVIVLNGGWMPISPATLQRMYPTIAPDTWQIGSRLGVSKDMILPQATTRLGWLADRFVLPAWVPPRHRVAFSLGDIFIALGAFLLMWSLGNAERSEPTTHNLTQEE